MEKTTDELVEIIVAKIGIPLPNYDYDYKKYVSVIPENISFGNSAMGIEKADMHNTFKEACLRIVNRYDRISNGL